MAVTIQQEPTTPNMANSNLVFSCTSTQVTQPQFQFVVDIKDKNDVLIQRVKQQPNPSANGVFDFGNIIPTTLGPTDSVWNITSSTANTDCGKDIKVYFGEEYGTSVSSSVTLYTPATSGSQYYFMVDGFVNESALLNWNWASGSKYDEEDPLDDVTFSHQNGLTSFNTSSVRLGDYHTISFLNGNLNGASPVSSSAQDVFGAAYSQYDVNDNHLSTNYLYNTTTGLRTVTTQTWDEIYTSQSEATRLVHWPTGLQNLEDASVTIQPNVSYYIVTFHAQGTDRNVNDFGIWGSYRFDITDRNCGYNGVRFAWKNQYGVWDYYNFSLAESTTSNIERQEYNQSFVNFSNTTNLVPYNRERRGRTQYYNKVNKRRTANTDYLTQENADNLRELFFSTEVYVQKDNGEFWPVVITTASVTEKINPRSQKLFRYEIEYSYANGQRPRR